MDNITLGVKGIVNWLDIIIIIILTYSAIRGLLTGLVLSLSNLLAFVVGLFVAINYKGVLTDFLIVVWSLDDKIATLIESKITINQAAQLVENLPPILNAVESAEKMISISLAQQAINIFSFFFLLIITNLIIKAIGYLFHSLFDWGLFAPINRIGGMFFGVVRGLLLAIIILVIITPLPVKGVEQSYFGEKVHNNLMIHDLLQINDWLSNNRS